MFFKKILYKPEIGCRRPYNMCWKLEQPCSLVHLTAFLLCASVVGRPIYYDYSVCLSVCLSQCRLQTAKYIITLFTML